MPYDRKNNPNNNRLPVQNVHGKKPLSVGDYVYRVFGDMRHSAMAGVVERTDHMLDRVVVRWPNGVAYQEDPLYLVKKEELPYIRAAKSKLDRSLVDSLLQKSAHRSSNYDIVDSYDLDVQGDPYQAEVVVYKGTGEMALRVYDSKGALRSEDVIEDEDEILNVFNALGATVKGSDVESKSEHSKTCSCPVCHSKTAKLGKRIVCTSEGCFFVKEG